MGTRTDLFRHDTIRARTRPVRTAGSDMHLLKQDRRVYPPCGDQWSR